MISKQFTNALGAGFKVEGMENITTPPCFIDMMKLELVS